MATSYSLVGIVTLFMGALCLIILTMAKTALDVGAILGVSLLLVLFGAVMYRLRPQKPKA